MDEAARAVAASQAFEAKKDGLRQVQEGDWKLTLTVRDLPSNIMQHAMGQRYQVVVVAIDDNEQPIPPQPETGHRKWREMRPSQRAALLCKRADFQVWRGLTSEDEAANWVRKTCSISSRSELDSLTWKLKRFEGLIEEPFFEHLNRLPDEVYQ